MENRRSRKVIHPFDRSGRKGKQKPKIGAVAERPCTVEGTPGDPQLNGRGVRRRGCCAETPSARAGALASGLRSN